MASSGLMTFTLAETLWLWEMGFENLLLAYPTADRQELARLAAIDDPGRPVIMVDSVEQLDFIESCTSGGAPTRVCIEIDLSFWTAGGRVKIGTKRSPIRTPEQAATLAREIERRSGVELVGLMGYEGHIAGVGDSPRERVRAEVIRRMRKSSITDIRERRAAIVEAVSKVAPLVFVNGGGTGSLELTAAEDAVTELTAGSGFYAPTLFDHYSSFNLRPAAMFALPVVRRPAPGWVTLLGGGYLASGPADDYRLPHAAPSDRARARLDGGCRRGPDTGARPRRRTPEGRATACTCATRRRASCASASSRSTWSPTAGSWTRSRRTAARAARSYEPEPEPLLLEG